MTKKYMVQFCRKGKDPSIPENWSPTGNDKKDAVMWEWESVKRLLESNDDKRYEIWDFYYYEI